MIRADRSIIFDSRAKQIRVIRYYDKELLLLHQINFSSKKSDIVACQKRGDNPVRWIISGFHLDIHQSNRQDFYFLACFQRWIQSAAEE